MRGIPKNVTEPRTAWSVFVSLFCVCLGVQDVRAEDRQEDLNAVCTIQAPGGLSANTLHDEETGLCHGFVIKRNGKKLVEVRRQFLGSGSVLISGDGDRAVFVTAPFVGTLRGNGRFEPSRIRREKLPIINEALVFFRGGKKLASYTLESLLHRSNMVHVDANHVHWLLPTFDIFRRPLPHHLRLATMSLRDLVFDTRTGALISANDSSEWATCPVIAHGEVHFDGQPLMDPVYQAKGVMPDRITFRIPMGQRVAEGYQTRCFRRGRRGWIVGRQLPSLNGLAVAPAAGNEDRFACRQDADCVLHCDAGSVNRAWFETHRASLGQCKEGCDEGQRTAACVSRHCVTRDRRGDIDRACSRRH